MKGQKARTGVSINGFEGGQLPIYRRMPKRGFVNVFRKDYAVLNLGALDAAIESGRLPAGEAIDHRADQRRDHGERRERGHLVQQHACAGGIEVDAQHRRRQRDEHHGVGGRHHGVRVGQALELRNPGAWLRPIDGLSELKHILLDLSGQARIF